MNIRHFVFTSFRGNCRYLFVAALVVLSGFTVGNGNIALAQGAGDLIVAPTRIVLQGRERTAQLTLLNKGTAPATYRISAINMRMDDDGTVHEIEKPDPGQNFATKLFRYSPRQVTLQPGAAQAIRILLRKPKDLADGEYRSHMFFRGVPDNAGDSVEKKDTGDGIAVRLIPVYGISIPVIIRNGKTDMTVSMSGLQVLQPDDANVLPRLRFQINRQGNRSAFGDLVATYQAANGGDVVIGQLMRLAVYTPNAHRTVEMQLRVPDGVQLNGGKIKLAYKETVEDGGKMMSSTEFTLP